MQQASDSLEYERAAHYRDQVKQLRAVVEKQYIYSHDKRDTDVLACVLKGGQACIQVFYFRNGRNLGNKAFYPKVPVATCTEEDVIEAFVSQYYLSHEIPDEIIISHAVESMDVVAVVLSEQAGKSIILKNRVRGDRAKWLANAEHNAMESLDMRLAKKSSYEKQLLACLLYTSDAADE